MKKIRIRTTDILRSTKMQLIQGPADTSKQGLKMNCAISSFYPLSSCLQLRSV